MLIGKYVAGPDYERRAELTRPSAGAVLTMAGRRCLQSAGDRFGSGELEHTSATDLRDLGGLAVGVDQDRERNFLVVDERPRVSRVTGSDGHDLGSSFFDLLVVLAQLRGVVPAMQSPEVPEKHEDYRPVAPVVAEPVIGAVGVGERQLG